MNRRRSLVILAVFAGVIAIRLWFAGEPQLPGHQRLSDFPNAVGSWYSVEQAELPPSLTEVVKADDYVLRKYQTKSGEPMDLFIAYYKAQKAGDSMHSPKNCFPAWGFEPVSSDTIPITAKGRKYFVNRYIVQKGKERAVVIYWYQAHGRVVSGELSNKVFLMWDALTTRRRDGGIVRLAYDVPRDSSLPQASIEAANFAEQILPEISRFIPN